MDKKKGAFSLFTTYHQKLNLWDIKGIAFFLHSLRKKVEIQQPLDSVFDMTGCTGGGGHPMQSCIHFFFLWYI